MGLGHALRRLVAPRPARAPVLLKSFDEAVAAAGGVVGRADAGYQVVATADVVGSLDRWRTLRRDFLPLDGSVTARHRRVAEAMREGKALPPLELYAVCSRGSRAAERRSGEYYVVDGHHRVAMARRLGQDFLDAHVVEYRVAATDDRPAVVG